VTVYLNQALAWFWFSGAEKRKMAVCPFTSKQPFFDDTDQLRNAALLVVFSGVLVNAE